MANWCTKFRVSSFSRFRDISGGVKFFKWATWPWQRPSRDIFHRQAELLAMANLYTRCGLYLHLSQRYDKKLSYRRGTARCVVSVEILPIAMQQCRNYLYDKSWTNRSYEVGGLQCREMCNKHVHSTMTQLSRFHCLIGVINKPTTLSCVYHLYTDDLLWRNFLKSTM